MEVVQTQQPKLKAEKQKKTKKTKLPELKRQLTEGIVNIVVSNPDLEATGPVDPAFDEAKQAQIKALIDKAKGDAHVSQLLFEMLDAGTHWAFGALHYVWKVNTNYEARTGMDMFSFYKQQVVPYDFFKQREIKVNKVGIPALQEAERNFASSMSLAGVDHTLEISRETRAFSFRSERDEARSRNLNNPVAKLSEHDLGLAVDVNYDGTARNPRVAEPAEIWEIVRLVIGNDSSLADVNPSVNLMAMGANAAAPVFEKILQASAAFRRGYPDWCREFAKDLDKDLKQLPTADEYQTLLMKRDQGVDKKAMKEMEALDSDRSKAKTMLANRRGDLIRQHTRVYTTIEKRLTPVLNTVESKPFAVELGTAMSPEVNTLKERSKETRSALSSWLTAQEVAKEQAEGGARGDASLRELESAAKLVFALVEVLDEDLRLLNLTASINSWDCIETLSKLTAVTSQLQQVDAKSKDVLAKEHAELEARSSNYAEQSDALDALDKEASAQAESDPQLAHLRVLRLHDAYLEYYEAWSSAESGVGFADFNPAFVLAMDKAGWVWGARFSTPDFHHFEYQT